MPTQFDKTAKYDTIIVGAGSAGCVLANRLSQDATRNVLLIEAGGNDHWHWLHIPVGYLYAMNNPRSDWCYSTTAQPGLNNRAIPYPRGKVLGGCSAINGMIYIRGHQQDYDEWKLPGWTWNEVLPRFKRTENYFGGASENHGTEGELRVEQQRLRWDILDVWRQACNDYGIPDSNDFNTGNNEGVGLFHVNQVKGVRQSAKRAFLSPIKHRPNLTILKQCLVDKLRWKNNRVSGLDIIYKGKKLQLTAQQDIILSAGAVSTPCILQRSGIGKERDLQAAGIQCQLKLDGVGDNLHDHLQVRLAFEISNATTLNEKYHSPIQNLYMAAQYALFRSGPLSMAPSQLGAFFKSDNSLIAPDLEYHVQPLTTTQLGSPLDKQPGITASICNLQPTSRGSLRIASSNPAQMPLIDPNYLASQSDQQIAARSIEITREIASQQAVTQYSPKEIRPGAQLTSNAELIEAAGNIASSIFHPVGTCKMGLEGDALAVTNEKLKVKSFDNLYIADASVMPKITRGNTHAPVVMIAQTLADILSPC